MKIIDSKIEKKGLDKTEISDLLDKTEQQYSGVGQQELCLKQIKALQLYIRDKYLKICEPNSYNKINND